MNHNPHKESFEDREIRVWKKRLIGVWMFTIPIVILMIIDKMGFVLFDESIMTFIILILAFPVIFVFGFKTIKSGLKGFLSFYFNMDSLIALGTLVAYLTGVASFFFSLQDYSGISSMIMAFFITGKYIETKARGKATQEIRKLLELGARNARILMDKEEIEIPIKELKIGDIMIIKPGEKIPTDGIIVKGESSVDESMITGESIPNDKTIGSNVIGATINQEGILYVKATKIGKDTFLSHIINLIEEAQSTKVPIQAMADKITRIFVPSILFIAILTFVIWWLFADLSKAFGIAVAVLVIACPCALGLATPTALMVSSGMGAKRGILIRKGEAIQTMKKIKTIVFDKTGTITKGKPEVRELFSLNKEKDFLELVASIEKLSEHPIAKAIVEYSKLIKFKDVKKFKVLRGRGLEGEINRKKIMIGNRTLMNENNIFLNKFEDRIKKFESKGYTTMIVVENKKPIGIIGVADDVKEDSVKAINYLNRKGFRTIMITGDNEATAKAISQRVNIKEFIANVLPEDKANKIKELQKSGFVAFIGDGINDAPGLKQANVGIAIGTGTDIAIESGDIVLSKGSLIGVVQAINLSKATFKKIKQNLFWAFGYNVLMIPLAITGFIHPVFAEIAMALSSITVVMNANLLRNQRI
ncbi:MAG: copper-translocating P-type ATPase [Candidatus Nanoarchaeia archaeon]|nr:copper-translocating P-type ATPase [Candidatus Nanoarchaeia archaeon]